MFFIPTIRERLMRSKVNNERIFYRNTPINQVSNYHLNTFNKEWQHIQKNIPYYQRLVKENVIPEYIKTWEDFAKIPIQDRTIVRENISEFSDITREADKYVTTGGSTGTPLKYPSWKEESKQYEPNLWYARSFYNIKRSDRMFRLWGHSHALGSGISRYKKEIAFLLGLPLIGFKRFSAYDLSDDKLKQAGESIIKFKPKYIIGYSKALYMLAKANKHRKKEFHKLNLKAIIGAAEGFDNDHDKEFISNVFGCPVGLEYASMETKLLAHTHPDGSYKVLWRNNLVECVDEYGRPSDSGRLLVTSLYPRAFPLVRYELGDLISKTNKIDNSVISFEKIKGRDNDFLMLDEKTPIHSEALTHAIKTSTKIEAFQIRYTTENQYTIYVKSSEKITKQDKLEISNRLKQIDIRLYDLKIKQTSQLKQTIAGKTRWLIEE